MAASLITVSDQCWIPRWKGKLYQISTYHSIDWEQLVPPFEPSMPFRHSSRNDTRNINGWVLFLSSHDIKAQAFVSLWQLYHPRVWVAFARSKSSNCCLEEKNKSLDCVGRTGTNTLLCACGRNSPKCFSLTLPENLKPLQKRSQCFGAQEVSTGRGSLGDLSKATQHSQKQALGSLTAWWSTLMIATVVLLCLKTGRKCLTERQEIKVDELNC